MKVKRSVTKMPRHEPATFWSVKKIGIYPNSYVQTTEDNKISISLFHEKDADGAGFKIDRRFARLLSKRINQCLDETK